LTGQSPSPCPSSLNLYLYLAVLRPPAPVRRCGIRGRRGSRALPAVPTRRDPPPPGSGGLWVTPFSPRTQGISPGCRSPGPPTLSPLGGTLVRFDGGVTPSLHLHGWRRFWGASERCFRKSPQSLGVWGGSPVCLPSSGHPRGSPASSSRGGKLPRSQTSAQAGVSHLGSKAAASPELLLPKPPSAAELSRGVRGVRRGSRLAPALPLCWPPAAPPGFYSWGRGKKNYWM